MKRAEKVEKLIGKFEVDVDGGKDRAILNELLEAQAKCGATGSKVWKIFVEGKMAKVAAAALVIIVICVFFVFRGSNERIEGPAILQAATPSELTTFGSFSFAYRQGGMERVEQICDKALAMAGPHPGGVSMRDFFEEFNGEKPERK